MAFAGVAAAVGLASAASGAIGAYLDAKAQKKAIKANRDAEIKVLKAETEASLKSLSADTNAQALVIESDARARVKAALYEADTQNLQNIAITQLLRRDALNRGLLDEFSFRREASQVQGQQRARLGSSGVDVNSGSAAWLQEEQIVATDLDALAIRQNAVREGFGFDLDAYASGRARDLALMDAASTGEVSSANIKGLRETAKVRTEGIRKTAKVNEAAIRKTASASAPSPGRSALLSAVGSGSSFASSWYLSR